jgi:hypothetical protein
MTARGLKIHMGKIHDVHYGDDEKKARLVDEITSLTNRQWSDEEMSILKNAAEHKLIAHQIDAIGLIKGRTKYAIEKKLLELKRGKDHQPHRPRTRVRRLSRNGATASWSGQEKDITDHWNELCNHKGRTEAVNTLCRSGFFQGRTRQAVLCKIWAMQVKGELEGIPWVKSEVRALQQAWKNCGGSNSKSYAHLAEELDRLGFVRSIQDVTTQAESMGMVLSSKESNYLPKYLRDWTKEEDEALVEAVRKGMGASEIFETSFIPGRSIGGIEGRMSTLSLTGKCKHSSAITDQRKHWTNKEKSVLRNYADQLNESRDSSKVIREIIGQGLLKRSGKAIWHKFYEMQARRELSQPEIPQSEAPNLVHYLQVPPRNPRKQLVEPSVRIGVVDANRPLASQLALLDELHKRGCETEAWNKHFAKTLSLVDIVYDDIESARRDHLTYEHWQNSRDYQEYTKFQNEKFETEIEAKEQERESQIRRNLIVDRDLKTRT